MPLATFTKDPNAILDYSIDWSFWLNGDVITSSTWTVPGGITQTAVSFTTTIATIWLSGGSLATTYTLVNRIVTAGGRTEDRTILITLVDR